MSYNKHNFKNIFRAVDLPCLVLDLDFTIVDASDDYLKLSGRNFQDLIGKAFSEIFPESLKRNTKNLDLLTESLDMAKGTGEKHQISSFRQDIIAQTGEPVEKYWKAINVPMLNPEGKVEYLLHQVKDVTEEVLAKKKEQQLKKESLRNRQMYHFVEKSTDGLYAADLNGNFSSVNEGLSNILEISMNEVVKMNFLPFCATEDREMILENFERTIKGDTMSFEARYRTATGNLVFLQVTQEPMVVENKVVGVYGIAKDITDLRKSEKVILEKSNFLEVGSAFISMLLKDNLGEELLEEAFAYIGKAVDVDRMYYFAAESADETGEIFISQKSEWCREGISPQINNPELQQMPASQVKELMGTLTKNKPFQKRLSQLPDGPFKELFIDEDIKSMLVMPIFLKDSLYGFIGFDDCRRERFWKKDEVTFLQSLTHNLTTALEKQAAEIALKEREEVLRRSEQKFKALVQEGSDLMAILDEQGNYIFASDSHKSILGRIPQAYKGRSIFDFLHPEEKENLMGEFEAVKEGSQLKLPSVRFLDQSGLWRWIQATVTNMLDDPAVQGVVINARDVTTILNQGREIEEINERYRLAALATEELIYDWNLEEDNITRFHQSRTTVFGHDPKVVDKRSFWPDNVHPDEKDELRRIRIATLNDPNKNFMDTRYRLRRADGSYAHIRDKAYIIRNQEGKPLRIVGASSDISDIIANKEALNLANERFQLAMKASNEMIWDWDIKSGHVERSNVLQENYGYNPTNPEMESFWLPKVFSEDKEAVRKSLDAALNDTTQTMWQHEYRFLKADGEIAYVVDRAFISRDRSGKAVRMVGAVLDVTQSRRSIRKIEEQNRLLKEIAWEQSHLVRAPLSRIQGLVELLELESFNNLDQEELWGHIKDSTVELDEIIRSIVKKTDGISGKFPAGGMEQ